MPPISLLAVLLLPAADPAVTAAPTADGTAVEFRVGGELVTRYVHAGTVAVEKGAGTKPLAKPYCHPLLAPGGVAVTRDWPLVRGKPGETTDHFHQKSVWFCHGDVVPTGLAGVPKSADKRVHGVDFWAEAANHGRIVCDKAGAPEQVSPTHVRVVTKNRWLTPDDRPVLVEARTVSLHALPADAGGGRLLVFDCVLAAVESVRFADTKEGAFGVRVRDEFALSARGSAGVVTSSTGKSVTTPAKDNLPLWGEEADWHDYSGTAGGKAAGVAVFASPANRHRSAWHTRAYGLMAANPFAGKESGFPSRRSGGPEVALAKGQTLTLRYAVYAHAGDVKAGGVAAAYAWFGGRK